MVTRLSALPPKLQEISEDLSQSWGPADCSEDLREAAHQLLEQNREIADRRLVERGWGGNPDT